MRGTGVPAWMTVYVEGSAQIGCSIALKVYEVGIFKCEAFEMVDLSAEQTFQR